MCRLRFALEIVVGGEAPPEDTVTLVRAGLDAKPEIAALFAAYLTENAQRRGQVGAPPADVSEHPYFDRYWFEDERIPFLIRLGDRPAGFILLRRLERRWHIAEFYVIPELRRQRVGSVAVTRAIDYCRAAADLGEIEAWVELDNVAACHFWRSLGFRR